MAKNISVNFPVEEVRSQFPALRRSYKNKSVVYFDGPGGSQAVQSAINAITQYMESGMANLHGQFPTSIETEAIIAQAKESMADLLNTSPEEIAFGANATTLAFAISRALCRIWREEDEIVVTEIDHRCNVDPWVSAAKDTGSIVRWLEVDPQTLTLDLSNLESIITPKTRLVAVTLASNAVGTITDVQHIAARAKEVGALLVIDAVHAVPHFFVDRDALQADIILCSSYKFFGPHVGIAAIRSELFASLDVYKLEPAPTYIPDKLETGTQNHEGIAGISPAVEFIAQLGEGETRTERIVNGYERIESYENHLATMLRNGLGEFPEIQLYQAPESVAKTPTIAFRIGDRNTTEICKWFVEEHAIFIADGDFYASTLAEKLGIRDQGGWVRIGLAPYNTVEEVERFLGAMREYLNK